MSDEEPPDNVRQLPRIGSPPPPPVPPAPDLDDAPAAPDPAPGAVRISSFDAPAVPVAPPASGAVPAALRADGIDPGQGPDAGPPRAGGLSLAVILAIALAAFEGLQTWIQESGPRRAEAAAHARELELLGAKARADAERLGAEADSQRARSRVPSSHEYGRSTLGSRSGPAPRSGGGTGPGGLRRGATGSQSGPVPRPGGLGGRGPQGRSDAARPTRNPAGPPGSSGRSNGGRGGGGSPGSSSGGRSGGRGGGSGPGGSSGRAGPGPRSSAGAGGRGSGGNSGVGGGTSRGPLKVPTKGTGGATGGGTGRTGGGSGPQAAGASGRRSPRQAVTDWFRGRRRTPPAGAVGSGSTQARIRDAVARTRAQPTFWDLLGSCITNRSNSKKRRAADTARPNSPDWAPPAGSGPNASPGQDRVTLGQAVFEAFRLRWDKRRDEWKARGGPRPKAEPRDPGTSAAGEPSPGDPHNNPGGAQSSPGDPHNSPGPGASQRQQQATPPPGAAGAPGPGPFGPRTSVFDTDDGPEVVITSVEQIHPPGTHAKRWEPDAITSGQQQLPRQSTPALPRAPHRPAGQRPGTTRRKEPIPMAATTRPYTAIPRPGGMDGRHATDITHSRVIRDLSRLVTEGMETHDDSVALARGCAALQAAIEVMTDDLAAAHNVGSKGLMTQVAELQNTIVELKAAAGRMAKNALEAAELAEAEENAIKRDYQPVADATADAGLHAPSARLHNEN